MAEGSPCLDKLPSPHPSVYNKLFKLHLLMEDFQNNAKLILIDSDKTMFKELQINVIQAENVDTRLQISSDQFSTWFV